MRSGLSPLLWNALLLTASNGVSQAGARPNFSVELLAGKATYIQREPIILSMLVTNKTGEDFTIAYPPEKSPSVIAFYWVPEDGEEENLGEVSQRRDAMCGNESLTRPYEWTIKKGSNFVATHWDANRFPAGKVRFRAKFVISEGEHRGAESVAHDLEVTVVEPEGVDRAAYEFMTTQSMIPTAEGRYSIAFLDGGLIPHSGSHHGKPLFDVFLRRFGDSTYACYLRYTLSLFARHPDTEEASRRYESLMERIVRDAPRDFPLLPECYAQLINYYLERSELARAAGLAKEVQRHGLRIVNPMVWGWLEESVGKIAWWPPSTPEEWEVARIAKRVVEARQRVDDHWFVRTMTGVYGPAYQFRASQDEVTMLFTDTRQSWALPMRFDVGEDGVSGRLSFAGSLETYCIGRLAGPLGRLKREHDLNSDEALKSFLKASLEDGVIRGTLKLPARGEISFEEPLVQRD